MNITLASTILDTIRDSLELHTGFCRWSDDLGGLWWVVSFTTIKETDEPTNPAQHGSAASGRVHSSA